MLQDSLYGYESSFVHIQFLLITVTSTTPYHGEK